MTYCHSHFSYTYALIQNLPYTSIFVVNVRALWWLMLLSFFSSHNSHVDACHLRTPLNIINPALTTQFMFHVADWSNRMIQNCLNLVRGTTQKHIKGMSLGMDSITVDHTLAQYMTTVIHMLTGTNPDVSTLCLSRTVYSFIRFGILVRDNPELISGRPTWRYILAGKSILYRKVHFVWKVQPHSHFGQLTVENPPIVGESVNLTTLGENHIDTGKICKTPLGTNSV